MRPNVRSGVNLRRWINSRAGMNAGREWALRKKERQCLRESNSRVRHANERLLCRMKRPRNQNCGRGALFRFGEKRFVFRESQIARTRSCSRGKACQNNRSVAFDLSSEFPGN